MIRYTARSSWAKPPTKSTSYIINRHHQHETLIRSSSSVPENNKDRTQENSSGDGGIVDSLSSSRWSNWMEEQGAGSTNNRTKNGIFNLLTDRQRTLLDEQRSLTKRTKALAEKIQLESYDNGTTGGGRNLNISVASSPFLHHISTTLQQDNDKDHENEDFSLDSTFSVVLAGEFNAGKSTIINALLGQKLQETGSLPTTDSITVLTTSSSTQQNKSSNTSSILSASNGTTTKTTVTTIANNNIIIHKLPSNMAPILKDLTLIDTPGTNAILSHHTTTTLQLLPSADLILFITSADKPFAESEQRLLESIQHYRKNIVIVINKMDVLERSGGDHGKVEKERMVQFVREHAREWLGARPVILSISARDALSAKLINSSSSGSSNYDASSLQQTWKRSQFQTLQSFLRETLTEETKIQTKLLNPVGVCDGILKDCIHVLQMRRKELKTDLATVAMLTSQMDSWRKDLEMDVMKQFQLDVKKLMDMEGRKCRVFMNNSTTFDKLSAALQFGNATSSSSTIQTKWGESKPIYSKSNEIEQELLSMTRECSDGIATMARAQGQAVIEYLGKRPAVVGQNLIGSVTAASRFEDTRKGLQDKLQNAVKIVLETHDTEREYEDVIRSLVNTTYICGSLCLIAGSSGVMTALNMIDALPGGVGTGVFLGLGIATVPYRNRQLILHHEEQWKQRSAKLDTALENSCQKEAERIHKRIVDGVAPYIRYVRTEEEQLEDLTQDCEGLMKTTQTLRNRIRKYS